MGKYPTPVGDIEWLSQELAKLRALVQETNRRALRAGRTVLVEVADGSDLNGFVANGEYQCSGVGTSYPVAVPGMLRVRSSSDGAFVYQSYQTHGADNRLYWRGKYAGSWGAWKQAVTA